MNPYRHFFLSSDSTTPLSFKAIYGASILFTFQSIIVAYSSSSYLEQFITTSQVGIIFALASFGAIVLTLGLPRILREMGNVTTLLVLMLVCCVSLILIGLAPNFTTVITAFILFNAVSPLIYLNLDVFLEATIGQDEQSTGSRRGLTLALMSIASMLAPLAMGVVIGVSEDLRQVYYTAAAVGLVFMAYTLSTLRRFRDPEYPIAPLTSILTCGFKDKDITTVLATHFLLQFFFSWAIIYIPLYLATELNYSWDKIGYIISAGLLAYVLCEYPIGILADERFGEKEMMALGFVILALTAASLNIFGHISFIALIVLMFINRIGASLVEVTTESYFFKQVDAKDTALISVFRLMRPLASLSGALVGSIALSFLPFDYLFYVLAFFMVAGAFITQILTDTK